MKRALVTMVIVTTAVATAGCASLTTLGTVSAHAMKAGVATLPVRTDVAGPKAECQTMLPGRDVEAWERVTVGALRAYQYSGPVPHRPLVDAFVGARPGQAGLWCWTQTTRETGSLWGGVPSLGVVRAITISGPGPRLRGVLSGPPLVP